MVRNRPRCHGIQLKDYKNKGRLVIPCDHIEAGSIKYFSHVIYSDDHGETWKLGILFEGSKFSPYEEIVFTTFGIK